MTQNNEVVGNVWSRGLVLRVTAFLSLALAPIGVVGIIQTLNANEQTRSIAEMSLLTITSEAASREKRVIERGLGAADALGPVAFSLSDDSVACSQFLRNFVDANPGFVFAGFAPMSGLMTCSTADAPIDLSDSPYLSKMIENPRSNVTANAMARGSRTSVVVLTRPVFFEDDLVGFLSLSVPQADILPGQDLLNIQGPLDLITFNAFGEPLTSEVSLETVGDSLPSLTGLTSFVGQRAQTFSQPDRSGIMRVYTVVPVVPGVAYALGVWEQDGAHVVDLQTLEHAVIYPILMWLASIGVAVFALHRLVIRPIRGIERDMARFSTTRELPEASQHYGEPAEIVSIKGRFREMAMAVSRDEADLENLIYEKDGLLLQKSMLLKEVHHRVKNNLQLISSIMNMQVRIARSPETRQVVRRLQERVQGLSAIHRKLYQADSIDQIDVGLLTRELAAQTEAMVVTPGRSLNVKIDTDRVILYPDQAVPYSLLISELLTNAVKYSGTTGGDAAQISVELRQIEEASAELIVRNTLPEEVVEDDLSTGLGKRLITAFVTQLEGEIEVEQTDAVHTATVRFDIHDFKPETPDY